MITNNSVTIYHNSGLDIVTHNEVWERNNYTKVWVFEGENSNINKGYELANDIQVRISYGQNENLNIANFKIGDIIVVGTLDLDITNTKDLDGYKTYVITSINNNTFGHNPHIHLGGK